MDKSLSWGPPRPLIVICWAAVVALVVWVIFREDPAERVLVSIAALALAGYAAFGTFLRPRLAADRTGVRVRSLSGVRSWDWRQVRVELVISKRLGRDLAMLEIEEHGDPDQLDEHDPAIFVLGWLDLGADPREVAEALEELHAEA
ncbi:PH (Pleckstrin Homology) domain-containing protein [Tamaricihabitans halophyticus]|uniref:PH (Pleckstrin Homology) domain-containing protein n=1 Tax=Tamaricihabitans halophyticus TaxID=1262583 RepID=A0A4R2R3T9_9PSEU|nr:PH domain-containing protein [Tamaricihabitans halophyticus]TCP54045.1 PH (Pleckstrin Homology) domain-containing protein [Tamaricihabitans halophyticus]